MSRGPERSGAPNKMNPKKQHWFGGPRCSLSKLVFGFGFFGVILFCLFYFIFNIIIIFIFFLGGLFVVVFLSFLEGLLFRSLLLLF